MIITYNCYNRLVLQATRVLVTPTMNYNGGAVIVVDRLQNIKNKLTVEIVF
jgi:hypothetical protein